VDCEKEQALCAKYGVQGYPTLKAIVAGKGKSYNGAREIEPMKEWITKVAANRGTKGGSAKCAQGMFKSRVKDRVVPLCEEHYPDENAKNEWLVLFYNEKGSKSADLKELANRVSGDMGNDPPDMSKALKKQKKRRERVKELSDKYELKVKMPAKGPFGMDALIKIGGVCCDCNEDNEAFCASSLRIGEEDLAAPQVYWVAKGTRTLLKDIDISAKALVSAGLEKLGFASGRDASEL